MASSVQMYQVTITNGGGGGAPADGFVDPKRVEDYDFDSKTTPPGMTLELNQAKERGNWRWKEIFNQLGLISNVYVHAPSIISDGTAIAEPTSVSFPMSVQYGDDAFTTMDELTPGQTLTGVACIIRCIARALAADYFRHTDVFDPTGVAGAWEGGAASVPRYGVRIDVASSFQVGPYADVAAAEGYITVAKI